MDIANRDDDCNSPDDSAHRGDLPWFKFFPTDWLDGTRNLAPEVRGIYADCLALIYKRNLPLPVGDDGDRWMMHQLHVPMKTWKRAKKALLEAGKLVEVEGGLSNIRANFERAKLKVLSRNSATTLKVLSRKPNEINGGTPLTHARACERARDSRYQRVEDIQSRGFLVAGETNPEDQRVTFAAGKIELHNGLKAYWLEMFEGDAKGLELGLTQAAAFIQANSSRPLEAQVSAQLARQCQIKRNVDKRAATKAKTTVTSFREQRQQENADFLSDFNNGFRTGETTNATTQ